MTKFNKAQLDCMRKCVNREIGLRKRFYPVWANDPNRPMTQRQAYNEIKIMTKVLELIDEQLEPVNLFSSAGVELEVEGT